MKNVLAYYRASLADAQIMAPDIGQAMEVPHDEVINGVQSAREIIRTFHGRSSEDRAGKDKPPSVWPVTIVYLRGTLPVVHGYTNDQKIKSILCLAASLHEDGKVTPSPDTPPWIPRDLLGTHSGSSADVIGSIEQADAFYTTEPYEAAKVPGIEEAIAYATGLLSHVTSVSFGPDVKSVEPYALADGALLVDANDTVSGTVRQLVSMMDHALKLDMGFPLAARLALGRTYGRAFGGASVLTSASALADTSSVAAPGNAPTALSAEKFWQAAQVHAGTMSAEYPLSPTQREAMHHFIASPEGSVVAVNGPPGTGKTTLLQSIVAQMLVDRATQEGRPDMPLIVATSANNQAVTNVIDSFGKVFDPESPNIWSRRWVPDVPSFGCFAASEKKAREGAEKGYLVLDVGFDKGKPYRGFISDIETDDWLRRATELYLTCASTALEEGGTVDKPFTRVADVVDDLQRKLVRTLDEANALLSEVTTIVIADSDLTLEEGIARQIAPIDEKRAAATVQVEAATKRQTYIRKVIGAWDVRQREEPWWFSWLSFVPGVKARSSAWAESFFVTQGWPDGWMASARAAVAGGCAGVPAYLSGALQKVGKQVEKAQQDVKSMTTAIDAIQATKERLENTLAKRAYAVDGKDPMTASKTKLRELSERLDITARARAFRIAARYWEGRYLLDLEEKLASTAYDSKAPAKLERMLRRIAKLTPCMVSTIYSLPKFYRAFAEGAPTWLLNSIDLLVVDEAGQVSPETGFGPFLLARKALVVGDTAQIEPVWAVSPRIDADNARAASILPVDGPNKGDYEYWAMASGCAAADGSLMRMAQGATEWRVSAKPALPDGLMLLEHRRCDPVIIDYCNELLYEGQLVACRPAVSDRILPAMGYANIQSAARKQGQSWVNDGEASVIAAWIAERRGALEAHYGKAIGQIVGVVTPFRPQRNALLRELGKKMGNDHGITVGTVHALQGAERDVVLFSPTYGEGFDGTPFFDRAPNMLNVAVSRARDSFLVFGNMALFNVLKRTPAGLLGQHLFREASNEIVDVDPKAASRFSGSRAAVLSGGPAHLEHLHRCLEEVGAGTQVIIASPYVTPSALQSTGPYLKQASTRGVEIHVYFDWTLSAGHRGENRNKLHNAVGMLKETGVLLYTNGSGKRQFHNKTLVIGDSELIEGSYNWLSASRNRNSKFHNHERSLHLIGDELGHAIASFKAEMNKLCEPYSA